MKRDRAYERLFLPYDPPLPPCSGARLPSIPCLWERARMMFGRVLKHIGSTASLARRWRLTRTEKKDVLAWLEPVEQLTRACLIVKAIAFLLMTPEGRRLMREPPKRPDPSAAPLHAAEAPGQERLSERAATPSDASEGKKRSAPFRVIRWTPAAPDPDQEQPNKPAPCAAMALSAGSLAPDLPPSERLADPAGGKQPPAARLARRIDALDRVLARPEEEARRRARFLVGLPRGALATLQNIYGRRRPWWNHGFEDNRLVVQHIWRAAPLLARDPEPG
jgi:hypothetical protein